MDTKDIRQWAETFDVERKTIEGFWYYINSYEDEEGQPFFEGDIDKNQLELTLNSVGLFIDAWSKNSYMQYGFDYIISYLPVIHKEDNLGTYKMFFKLNGEIFDDTFSPF
jgi:hypothetical protein